VRHQGQRGAPQVAVLPWLELDPWPGFFQVIVIATWGSTDYPEAYPERISSYDHLI